MTPGNCQEKICRLEVIGDRVKFGAKTQPRRTNRAQLALAASNGGGAGHAPCQPSTTF